MWVRQALQDEAKRKAKEDQEAQARKEAQDKREQEARAIQEAAQAASSSKSVSTHPPYHTMVFNILVHFFPPYAANS